MSFLEGFFLLLKTGSGAMLWAKTQSTPKGPNSV